MNGNLATTGVLQSINVKPDSLSKNSSSISKRQVNQLLDFRFIDQRDNLIFIGPPGVGKTHLAIGLGQKAMQAGYKVMFTTALGLVETREMAEIKSELKKRLNQISK